MDKENKRNHARVGVHEFSNLQEMPLKRTDMNKPSQFIQIAAAHDTLYALDELGKVWGYDQALKEWTLLSDIRKNPYLHEAK